MLQHECMHPNDGRVVSNFFVRALRDEPLVIHGDGSQIRAFWYVDDMVDGFVRLMDTSDAVTGPVNLDNPVELPVRASAERVIALTGTRPRLAFALLPADDPMQRFPDIAAAREFFGWEPAVPLDGGLVRTIAYFEAMLRARGTAEAAV